ncbi:hypothetical protein NUW54_g11299 [Trametes sanguinea]|uniref:Uncharacterized protein n=1 Tax=Trametes sanguinea TaxID=158606 RepID=A0ACC1NG92_9APHY|nr:hypothetical protein NUW54_g11299 [Trametes sanguinea]
MLIFHFRARCTQAFSISRSPWVATFLLPRAHTSYGLRRLIYQRGRAALAQCFHNVCRAFAHSARDAPTWNTAVRAMWPHLFRSSPSPEELYDDILLALASRDSEKSMKQLS